VSGALTVGQSVLERVDAVQNDGTWKGELSEHGYMGDASVGDRKQIGHRFNSV